MDSSILVRTMKNPAVIIGIVAIVIRLIIAPLLNCSYDDQDFGQIFRNLQTGNGLYGLDCYFYPPVWGYIVGLQAEFMNTFLDMGVLAERFTDILPYEVVPTFWLKQSATLLTPEFAAYLKIPIIICDVLVGYLLYKCLLNATNNTRIATIGSAIWLLYPTVIVMSGMKVMFDSMPALMMLLTYFLLKKDMTFFAGMMFSIGCLLKFFPLTAIFVIVGYIFCKHKGDGQALKSLVKGIAGVLLMAIVIYLPVILRGELMESIKFITMRTGVVIPIMVYIAIAMIFIAGYLMYITPKEKADTMLPIYLVLPMAIPVMLMNNPNYMMVLLPLLIIIMFTRTDLVSAKLLKIALILNGISAILTEIVEWNATYLLGVSEFTDLITPDSIFSFSNGVFSLWGGGFVNGMQLFVIEPLHYAGLGLILIALLLCVHSLYHKQFSEFIGRVINRAHG